MCPKGVRRLKQDEMQREQQHLEETLAVIREQLEEAAGQSERNAQAIARIQRERMEENRMDMGGMGSAQGFADLLELSQGMQDLSQAASAREAISQTVRTLLRMQDAPYFARIDFRFADGLTKPIYIGRATLMEAGSMRMHVYDWRVPIASVFYQYGVGPAQYVAPAGTIEGEVLLKRQYEIAHGKLLYFFDADEQILDRYLRELLSRPASQSMKGIVETIQRDQDRIIRDVTADLLMVQGSAGSGKTSVALHRVAYLMYQGLQKGRLSPNDILILAPNATFERYIAQVLPDLGERQVRTMLPEEMLAGVLPGSRIEPRGAGVERILLRQDATQRDALRHARQAKGSRAFLALLDRLIDELPRRWIPFRDVAYAGRCVARADLMRTSICNAKKLAPLGIQLRILERSIWARIHPLRQARLEALRAFAEGYPHHATDAVPYARMLSIRESGRILAGIRAFTTIDCAALYRALFADRNALLRLSRGLFTAAEAESIRAQTAKRLEGEEIPYEDAVAIAYLEARINGCRDYAHLRQVVVDEAQDLDALHAALMRQLFPNARFTVLGDIRQTLVGTADLSLYDEIRDVLAKRNSLLVTLDKSFRCTREIWAFTAQLLPDGAAGPCFSRSGEPPAIHRAEDRAAMDAMLRSEAALCRQRGCRSVALLCKTQRDAESLYARLKDTGEFALIGPDASIAGERASILSLYMAKGLEFDAVLLCDVDAAHYADEADRNLLYIGCTRALHVLRLYYTGEISPLVPMDKGAIG